MKEENGKIKVNATLVIDKMDPKELIDLYVQINDFERLCKLVGSNRVTVAIRMKGVG